MAFASIVAYLFSGQRPFSHLVPTLAGGATNGMRVGPHRTLNRLKPGLRAYCSILATMLFAGICSPVAGWAAFQAAAPDQSAGKPATPAEQFQALQKEFSTASHIVREPVTNEERSNAVARVDKIPLKVLELAEKNPKDPIAVDALIQVVSMEYWLNTYTSHPGWGKESRQAKAIALMLRDHIDSDKLGDACKRVHYGFRPECETFLRTVLEKSPHREVQGQACLRLAQFLLNRLDRLDLLKDQPEPTRRYEQLHGKDYLEALHRLDRAKVTREAELLYERASEKYGDVKMMYGEIVGETAKTELFEIRNLAIGKEAQEMEGVDQDGRQFKLSEYRGKVVLLYFWSEF